MDTQDLTNKLQRAYHAMLDQIEELVDKEGKNLKEAVEQAQEKLSEWEELSREEVDKISDEVKQDLSDIGEGMEGLRQTFRERLAMETRYLEEATMEKLGQIANKATLDMIQFNEFLRETAATSSEQLIEDEHQEHQLWESEHQQWLTDIDMWQKEHQEAEKKLLGIQDAIRAHAVALQEHAQTIRAHQVRDHQHEAAMAAVEKDATNENAAEAEAAADAIHGELRDTHANHARLHQQIKLNHVKIMVLVDQLYKLAKAEN